jgi:hypothetical protein
VQADKEAPVQLGAEVKEARMERRGKEGRWWWWCAFKTIHVS